MRRGVLGPCVLALQTVVPVLLAPVLTGEHWTGTPLGGAVVLGGLVLVVGGSTVLGAGEPVRRLAAPQARP